MAPTLSRLPLFVRPPLEQQNQRQQQRLAAIQDHAQDSQENDSSTAPIPESRREEEEKKQDDKDDDDGDDWVGAFDDQDENEATGGDGSSSAAAESDNASKLSPVQNTEQRSSRGSNENRILAVSPTGTEEASPQKKSPAELNEDHRKDIHRAVELYLGQSIDLTNVALSRQPIRVPTAQNGKNKRQSRQRQNGPSLEVVLVVCGPTTSTEEDNQGPVEEEQNEDEDSMEEEQNELAAQPTTATMTVVRLVNRIPLLDGVEASACGLVQGVLRKKKVWNTFGLEVTSTGLQGLAADDIGNDGNIPSIPQLPIFQVRDSDRVEPFIRNQISQHALFDDPFSDDDSDDDSDNTSQDTDPDVEDLMEGLNRRRKKRKKRRNQKLLLPAHVRLGNLFVIVQIHAEPSSLPLPSLSKVCTCCTGIVVCRYVLFALTLPMLLMFDPRVVFPRITLPLTKR